MPPTLTPRAIQVSRLLTHLRSAGWAAKVVTQNADTYPSHQILDFDLCESYIEILQHREQVSLVPILRESRRDLVRHLLKRDVEQPLMARWHERSLAATMRLAATGRYVALATFAGPWETHEMGLEAAKRTGLPWVAHFADPWVDNPYFASIDPNVMERWRAAEALVAGQADALVFVSEMTRDQVMAKYPREWRERTYVVPHAFESVTLPGRSAGPARRRMRIVHTGNFYGLRSAQPFLEGLLQLKDNYPKVAANLDVRFIGLVEPGLRYRVAEMGLDDMVVLCGHRPYRETLFEAACADLALVIDADLEVSVFLPSKIVDYMGLHRPILGITPTDGVTGQLLKRLQCPVLSPGDSVGLMNALVALHQDWSVGELQVGSAYHRVAQDFAPEQVSRRFALVLQQAVITNQERRRAASL